MYQVSFLMFFLLYIFFSLNLQSAVTSCYVTHFEIKTISFFDFIFVHVEFNGFVYVFMSTWYGEHTNIPIVNVFRIFLGGFFSLRCVYISAVGDGIWPFQQKQKNQFFEESLVGSGQCIEICIWYSDQTLNER